MNRLEYLHTVLIYATTNGGIQQHLATVVPVIEDIEQNEPVSLQQAVNLVKDRIQREANASIQLSPLNPKRGILALATGAGKSRIPVMQIRKHCEETGECPTVLIIVPTRNLRDTGWKEEFEKWGAKDAYHFTTTMTCYASLHKHVGKTYDYVIADECHNFTLEKIKALKQIICGFFYGLTATPPKDNLKQMLFKEMRIEISYYLSLDTAIALRMVSPYKATIVEVELDDKIKNVWVGPKANPILVTEKRAYIRADNDLKQAIAFPRFPNAPMLATMRRTQVIKTLKSKTDAAKFILEKVIPKEDRAIIFAGSIDQCIDLCEYRYFSKPVVKKTDRKEKKDKVARQLEAYQGEESFEAFQRKEIHRLACVEMLNEGNNLVEVDSALAAQLNSSDGDFLQRLGRIIRYRIGHTGHIYILVAKDTQDMVWVAQALAGLSTDNITRISFKELQEQYTEVHI